MFHEIGHCMHCVCAEVEQYTDSWSWAIVPWYGRPGLVGVEQDFLEVPSRMFEQWIQQRADVVLARLVGRESLQQRRELPRLRLPVRAAEGLPGRPQGGEASGATQHCTVRVRQSSQRVQRLRWHCADCIGTCRSVLRHNA